MKKFYIMIFGILIIAIIIFMLSFVYLDKNKHSIYYYVMNLNGVDVASVKIDKFVTEDKLIYKSITFSPLAELYTESRSKIVFDRKYILESYINERSANGATELIYIDNKIGSYAYIARINSSFSFLGEIATRKNTFIFEENSPVTYLPIVENYDFARGKSQGFSAQSCFSDWELPPMKRFVTFTSIKDEYLKIDNRNIKTENLLLKIRNYPQGAIWVAKSDRTLIKAEIPSVGLKITRTFEPREIQVESIVPSNQGCVSREVSFNNNNIRLSGTLTSPLNGEKNPAILLIWGDGPDNRDYRGFFENLSSNLAKEGYCSLRFDKRGIGLSDGSYGSYSGQDEMEDLKKAIDFLKSQKEVDPDKIFVLAHSRGARYGVRLASENKDIQGLILMAPALYSKYSEVKKLPWRGNANNRKKWTGDYQKSVKAAIDETIKKAIESRGNWTFIFFRRCFVLRIKEDFSQKYEDVIGKITSPVLILQGTKDTIVPAEAASDLDKLFDDCGNPSHTITFYGYLGHFFGKGINDGIHRIHYEIDKDVLVGISNWLKKSLPTAQ